MAPYIRVAVMLGFVVITICKIVEIRELELCFELETRNSKFKIRKSKIEIRFSIPCTEVPFEVHYYLGNILCHINIEKCLWI